MLIENRPGAINIKDWDFMNDGMNSFSLYNNAEKKIKDLLSFQRKVISDGVKLLNKISLTTKKKIYGFDTGGRGEFCAS